MEYISIMTVVVTFTPQEHRQLAPGKQSLTMYVPQIEVVAERSVSSEFTLSTKYEFGLSATTPASLVEVEVAH